MLKKIYEKNEFVFALIFLIMFFLRLFPMRYGFDIDNILILVINIIFTLIALLFIKKYKLEEKYGLNVLPKNSRQYLYFIPLFIVGSINLWQGIALQYNGIALFYASISMVLVGFIEEIVFRGFLFRAIENTKGISRAIVISSISFGIVHIFNLFLNPSIDTIMQVIYAISMGFVLVYIFYKSKSLWPCIIFHSIIDFTAVYSNGTFNTYLITIIIVIINIFYTLYLKNLKV